MWQMWWPRVMARWPGYKPEQCRHECGWRQGSCVAIGVGGASQQGHAGLRRHPEGTCAWAHPLGGGRGRLPQRDAHLGCGQHGNDSAKTSPWGCEGVGWGCHSGICRRTSSGEVCDPLQQWGQSSQWQNGVPCRGRQWQRGLPLPLGRSGILPQRWNDSQPGLSSSQVYNRRAWQRGRYNASETARIRCHLCSSPLLSRSACFCQRSRLPYGSHWWSGTLTLQRGCQVGLSTWSECRASAVGERAASVRPRRRRRKPD